MKKFILIGSLFLISDLKSLEHEREEFEDSVVIEIDKLGNVEDAATTVNDYEDDLNYSEPEFGSEPDIENQNQAKGDFIEMSQQSLSLSSAPVIDENYNQMTFADRINQQLSMLDQKVKENISQLFILQEQMQLLSDELDRVNININSISITSNTQILNLKNRIIALENLIAKKSLELNKKANYFERFKKACHSIKIDNNCFLRFMRIFDCFGKIKNSN